MKINYIATIGIAAVALWLASSACAPGGPKQPVPQPDVVVRALPGFGRDILPIFQEFCVQCHGPEKASNGLRLDSYEGAMKGTQFGTVIVPGKPEMSPLVSLIKHESDPKIWMPYHQEQLSPNRIKNIENWIRYDAPNN